jgi:hypothetical protein
MRSAQPAGCGEQPNAVRSAFECGEGWRSWSKAPVLVAPCQRLTSRSPKSPPGEPGPLTFSKWEEQLGGQEDSMIPAGPPPALGITSPKDTASLRLRALRLLDRTEKPSPIQSAAAFSLPPFTPAGFCWCFGFFRKSRRSSPSRRSQRAATRASRHRRTWRRSLGCRHQCRKFSMPETEPLRQQPFAASGFVPQRGAFVF